MNEWNKMVVFSQLFKQNGKIRVEKLNKSKHLWPKHQSENTKFSTKQDQKCKHIPEWWGQKNKNQQQTPKQKNHQTFKK